MKRRLLKQVIRGVFLAIFFLGLVSNSALAVANPDSISIIAYKAFQNIFEDGDQLFFAEYDVEYATDPPESANETFLMALYDTDGTTLLFQRPLNFYDQNIISVYLDSSDAVTWAQAYVIKISGNPTIFDPLTEGVNVVTKTLSPATDFETGAMATSRAALKDYCIGIAKDLEIAWSEDLITELLSGEERLNTTGGVSFNLAIPGLSSAVTDLFEVSSVTPTLPTTTRSIYVEGTITGNFVADETVTGDTSGATGTFEGGSQETTSIRTTMTGTSPELFEEGETVEGATASIVVTRIVAGQIEWEARDRTGTRLRIALNNFGAWLGMSGNAFGGLALFILFITAAGFIFVRTGQVHGAILIAIPVILLGNFMGLLSFGVTWMIVIIVALLFAVFFIMGKLA